MNAVGRVLVVGGGLGGLSTAMALAQAGCDVRLVERNTEWAALGAGLTFNGATARAFKSLGVLDQVVAEGFVHGTSDVCDHTGRLLVAGSDEPIYGPGVPVMGGIMRPILHAIMRDAALAAGVHAKTGLTVAGWNQGADTVAATFSDGTSETFDLAIGADGLMSHTRAQLFPDAPRPKFTGQGCWRAIAPRPATLTTSAVYLGGEHKAGINPVSDAEMYLFVLVSVADNPWYDEARWPDLLRGVLAGYGADIATVRDQLGPQSQINYRPLETIVVPRPWHRGNVLLIGDAAHGTTPHMGYGAGLAIEDGVVLAELVLAGLSGTALMTAFAERRYERCAAVVEGSVALGELEVQHAPIASQRALYDQIFARIREPV